MTSLSLFAKPAHRLLARVRHGLISVLVTGLACGLLAACGARVSQHGHMVNKTELENIEIGVSSREDVIEILGQPSFEGIYDTRKLYYTSQVMEQPVGGINTPTSRTIYILTIDQNNKLESIDLKDKSNGKDIVLADEKTSTPGDTYGFIDQIFSNVKRRQAEE